MAQRQSILVELFRHESFPATSTCSHCKVRSGKYRCKDCFGRNVWCDTCCINAHDQTPFHRIQMWNGNYFESSDLLDIGLTIDLPSHSNSCPTFRWINETQAQHAHSGTSTEPEFTNWSDGCTNVGTEEHTACQSYLVVVTTSGIFRRLFRWCQCINSSDTLFKLLVRAKLFPASFKNPRTVFTFDVLDHFWVDALECRTAAMSFMGKLRRITDEAFPSRVPVNCPTSCHPVTS